MARSGPAEQSKWNHKVTVSRNGPGYSYYIESPNDEAETDDVGTEEIETDDASSIETNDYSDDAVLSDISELDIDSDLPVGESLEQLIEGDTDAEVGTDVPENLHEAQVDSIAGESPPTSSSSSSSKSWWAWDKSSPSTPTPSKSTTAISLWSPRRWWPPTIKHIFWFLLILALWNLIWIGFRLWVISQNYYAFRTDPANKGGGSCLLSVTQIRPGRDTAFAGTVPLDECPPANQTTGEPMDTFPEIINKVSPIRIKWSLNPIPDREVFPLVSKVEQELGHRGIRIANAADSDSSGFSFFKSKSLGKQLDYYVKPIETAWIQHAPHYQQSKNNNKSKKKQHGELLEPWTKVKEGLLRELEAMEQFAIRHPHPNIVKYHGARVKLDSNGKPRVTGLVLDRQQTDLSNLVRIHNNDTKKAIAGGRGDHHDVTAVDEFVEQIESALKHMWKLGWAHNDVSPRNIAVKFVNVKEEEKGKGKKKKKAVPVLINFRNCRPFKEYTLEAGTPGFRGKGLYASGRQRVSMRQHDEGALENLKMWLKDPWVIPGDERLWGWVVDEL
ncbi:hypothetical protein QBC43DRAFT_351989 [Cladorrhinum sp. PSN259]|nr:hypothetical protein QBC43DRAFT_351989 [Cladorrhinum sp. PSN259]